MTEKEFPDEICDELAAKFRILADEIENEPCYGEIDKELDIRQLGSGVAVSDSTDYEGEIVIPSFVLKFELHEYL